MSFIKLDHVKDAQIVNSHFDGPGEHIDATEVMNLHLRGNDHRDSDATLRSFAEEVLKSKLADSEKRALLDEAVLILQDPTKDKVERFKGKLRTVGAVAVQLFTEIAAIIIGHNLTK